MLPTVALSGPRRAFFRYGRHDSSSDSVGTPWTVRPGDWTRTNIRTLKPTRPGARNLVYQFSRLRKAAKGRLPSSSATQVHGSMFRLPPQIGHRPRQEGEWIGEMGSATNIFWRSASLR